MRLYILYIGEEDGGTHLEYSLVRLDILYIGEEDEGPTLSIP